jgi:hypothetical protein
MPPKNANHDAYVSIKDDCFVGQCRSPAFPLCGCLIKKNGGEIIMNELSIPESIHFFYALLFLCIDRDCHIAPFVTEFNIPVRFDHLFERVTPVVHRDDRF